MNPDEALIALHELESHFLRQVVHALQRLDVVSPEERPAYHGGARAFQEPADCVHRVIVHLSESETVIRMKDGEA